MKLAPFIFQVAQWIIFTGAIKAAGFSLQEPVLLWTGWALQIVVVYYVGINLLSLIPNPAKYARFDAWIRSLAPIQLFAFVGFCAAFTIIVYLLVSIPVGWASDIALRIAYEATTNG